MTTIELAQKYQGIFRRRFPAIIVAPDPDIQFAGAREARPARAPERAGAQQTALDSPAKLGSLDRLIYLQYRARSASLASFERAAAHLADTAVLRAV